MNSKDKIIMITGFPPAIHGQAKSSKDIFDYFIGNNHEVIVLPLPDLKSTNLFYKVSFYFKVYLNLITLISFRQKPILYLSPGRRASAFFRDLPVLLWSKLFAKKVIIHLHGGEFFSNEKDINWVFRVLFEFAYSHIEYFVILSKNIIPEVGFQKTLQKKIVYIPYGIQTRKSGYKKDCIIFKIIYLSNLIPSKGYLEVLEIAKNLVNKRGITNIEINFCGNFVAIKNERNLTEMDFEKYLVDHDLTKYVKYHGPVVGILKEKMLEESHFFILPTDYPAEAQPISILEAMSFGIIVISTNYRAIPDMVINNHTGFLIEKDNIELMAKKIELLMLNPDIFENMQKNIYKHLIKNFSQEDYLGKIYNLFT
jgi:glycosyltransferase involved in cell wall biosynthesis